MEEFDTYSIEIMPKAEKDLRSINKIDSVKILKKILAMKYGVHGDIKKLTNYTPEYRLRVGDYRVLFEIIESKIIVYRVKHRKESYQ